MFLDERTVAKVHLVYSEENLHEIIPKEILLEEFGGTANADDYQFLRDVDFESLESSLKQWKNID